MLFNSYKQGVETTKSGNINIKKGHKMKTIRLGFTLIFLSILTFSFGQKNYSEGYIITWENDTIHGKIRDNFSSRSTFAPGIIKFIDKSGLTTKYLPTDIKGYSKAGFENYMTIQDDFGKNFARLIVAGNVKLLTIKKSGAFPVSNAGVGYTTSSINSISYYLYNPTTSQTTKVNPLYFKDQMAEYFSEYAELKEMIINKELRYQDIEIIVKKYNKWKDEITPSL